WRWSMKIKVPEEIEGLQVIASVSGGKDSTALMLALREAEIPFRAVLATFFLTRGIGVQTIDDVVAWSRTARGGRQIELLPVPTGGCVRWGLCDAPAPEGKGAEP